MAKTIYRLIVRGVKGVGMADALRSVYCANPPVALPRILTEEESMRADARVLAGDWQRTAAYIGEAYARQRERVHG